MNLRSFYGCLVLFCSVALMVSATSANAQAAWDSYAAKFVCKAQTTNDDVVIMGKYRTVINIHNPHYLKDMDQLPVPVQFFKKVVLAYPQGEPILRPSCLQEEFLNGDEALAVDCDNIIALLNLSGIPVTNPIEGFVVILVPPFQALDQTEPPSLDVVAVYTARQRTGTNPDTKIYDVKTMDVERVPPQEVIGEPVLDLCDPL